MIPSKLIIFNSSILTSYGTFTYEHLSLDQAKKLLHRFQTEGKQIQSAIGHRPTSELLTLLLEFDVPMNRIEFAQSVDQAALIFKLKRRPPEGVVLERDELERIGFEFGLLVRTA